MSKVFSFAAALMIAATAVGAAQAQDSGTGQRIIAQEKAMRLVPPATEARGHGIQAQERGRRSDGRLFGASGGAPILVAGSADGFDVGDAGIGAAAALAVSLLALAAAAFRKTSRQRALGATSAGR